MIHVLRVVPRVLVVLLLLVNQEALVRRTFREVRMVQGILVFQAVILAINVFDFYFYASLFINQFVWQSDENTAYAGGKKCIEHNVNLHWSRSRSSENMSTHYYRIQFPRCQFRSRCYAL